MKVLHINAKDIQGGAARAAYRIHKGLLDQNVDSKMLVQSKQSDEPEIITPYNSNIGKVISRLRPYGNSVFQKLQKTKNPNPHSFNILPSGLHKLINDSDADLVHLHWINGEMISIKEISKIKKPVVWTLHDMWVFCGAEHYDDWKSPGRYIEGYKKENYPKNYSGLDLDLWTWMRKKKHWENTEFNFVTPSRWLSECFKKSKLFKEENAKVIPNGLDTKIFKPTAKKIAKDILNLAQNKKIVLYGAIGAESNPIKGYQKLREAIKSLKENDFFQDISFVVFGNDYERNEEQDGVLTQYLGKITDDTTLSLIYSAADVMVVPSILEAFGQTASEAMACGTSVVAFNATGPRDIIDHKQNGYLAKPYSPEDLAAGIRWVLENEDRNNKLGIQARNKAQQKFALDKVASQYLKLYRSILD